MGHGIKHPGMKIEYSAIGILTGSDLSQRKLPFMSIKSINPGPVIWLTACIHGDEVGGMVAVQEAFKKIHKRGLLKGSIYAFPLMNPIGFETGSRHITLSKEDLNRSFPGDENGSLAERIAYKIFNTIKQTNPHLVLDLHNEWRRSIPYIPLDPNPGASHEKAYEKIKFFAQVTGFPVVYDTTAEMEKTLTYSLLQNDIPSFTLELEESGLVNERAVEHGVKAIWNILTKLGMVDSIEWPFSLHLPEKIKGKILKYSQEPVSHTSGIIRYLAKPGELVEKGKPIAKIYNSFGKLLETLTALNDGIVLGYYLESSVAFPGGPILAFGII